MMRFARLAVALLTLLGCASHSASPPRPIARPFEDVRRLAIVTSGNTAFTITEHRSEPGRTLDEVLAWHQYGAALRPLAKLVHRTISSALKVDPELTVARSVDGVVPRSVVVAAMARALQASELFAEVRSLEHEPTGEDRGRSDVLVRVTVPQWGLVRVRGADPDLLSSFADVGASMTVPVAGVVLWEHREDVTGPDQVPLDSFTSNRQFARQELIGVLERAGQRLASELLYARSAGR